MRVQSRHARDLEATVEEVGRLVAALGSERDELWPNDQWPGTRIEFDRPLETGARGGHGVIRYSVEAYEPGRLVRFRFDPGLGLHGKHGFDIEPLGDRRTRLVHTLDTRLEGAVRLAKPLPLRMHDTLLGQLLDNAERATGGRVENPTRMALWMRAMNAAEARLAGDRRPGRLAPLVRAGTWTLATVLVGRGAAFLVYDVANGFDTIYTRLDAAIYSPLCIALGLGAAAVARGVPAPAISGARA